MNYKTYADLSIDILQEIHKIPSDIDLVVGIPRSGMIPAYMIGTQLNLPVVSLSEFISGGFGLSGERKLKNDLLAIKNVMVVDDSIFSGAAMSKAKSRLNDKTDTYKFIYMAVYSATVDNNNVDFYLKYLPQPRIFQWNFKNHFSNTKACFDLDGVLCLDPTEDENDDGKNYLEFLKTAKPLFIPSYTISCLVTSRLEKYRKETEAWLVQHGVTYNELIMLDLPSAKERRALQIHGTFKAEVYAHRDEQLFVESTWNQAQEIFKLTHKPVFCTANDVFIKTLTDIVYYDNAVTYANRHFKDVFSDESELSQQVQNLRWQLNQDQLEKEKLNKKIKKLENNKWLKFSKLGRTKKVIFLIKSLFRWLIK